MKGGEGGLGRLDPVPDPNPHDVRLILRRRKAPPQKKMDPHEKCHQKVVLKTWSEGSGI